MLEYVFFNEEPCARFRDFLAERDLPSSLAQGELETLVQVEEERVDDDLADEIDAFYDQMLELDQGLYEQALEQDAEHYSASGVVVNLRDGRSVYAGVRPALLAKVMEALSPDELGDLVDAIVAAVEDPDERTFCQRMRNEGS
jgi:acylphosphatase